MYSQVGHRYPSSRDQAWGLKKDEVGEWSLPTFSPSQNQGLGFQPQVVHNSAPAPRKMTIDLEYLLHYRARDFPTSPRRCRPALRHMLYFPSTAIRHSRGLEGIWKI